MNLFVSRMYPSKGIQSEYSIHKLLKLTVCFYYQFDMQLDFFVNVQLDFFVSIFI